MKKVNNLKVIIFLIVGVFLTVALVAQTKRTTERDKKNEASCPMTGRTLDKSRMPEDCPMKKSESQTSQIKQDDQNSSGHHQMVMENGEKEMGFSQTATTHRFLIMKDGGAIQVEVNDAQDITNRDKIRTHLTEIAQMFQKGIFTTPFAVHGQVPPGVPEMDQLKNEIRYTYEETGKGARVRITTADPKALAAVHSFLKFQIEDHRTGDPTTVEN